MFAPSTSRALARLLFAVAFGLSLQAQAHGPRDTSAFIKSVPQATARDCRKVRSDVVYTPGPRPTLLPRVDCRDPSAAAASSPAAQGLMAYGPRNNLYRR
jgi:hypothetical protein